MKYKIAAKSYNYITKAHDLLLTYTSHTYNGNIV